MWRRIELVLCRTVIIWLTILMPTINWGREHPREHKGAALAAGHGERRREAAGHPRLLVGSSPGHHAHRLGAHEVRQPWLNATGAADWWLNGQHPARPLLPKCDLASLRGKCPYPPARRVGCMSSAITSSLELASTPIRGPRRMRSPILRSSLVRRIVRSAIPIQNATWRPSPGRSWRVSASRPTRNYGPSKPPRSSGSNDVSSWPKRSMSSSTRCSRTGAFPEARLTPRSAKPSLNLAARARSTAHQSSQTARFSDSCPPRPL